MLRSPHTFLTLPVEQQLTVLWAEGIFLAARWEAHNRVYLYYLGSFFTEVSCDQRQRNRLSTRACTTGECLTEYASDVQLDDLLLP
ncbi:hypothetical protein [Hymenobacter metallicola]|uniref:Uncharacterized protein n=1 Tax=Hymenobacter metallicola TaxID=2563114 RepID=A0A4Z0PUF3_9BACT|nr:hypothetical protein [Hymenobacter metallicola]TGE20906.1 hypothetical protein E5K02_25225 [Hymenobacter metallicola]